MTQFDEDFKTLLADFADEVIPATLITYVGVFNRATRENVRTSTSTPVSVSPPVPIEKKLPSRDGVRAATTKTILINPPAGLAAVPTPGSEVTVAGQTWEVLDVGALTSGLRTAAWELSLAGR